MAKRVFFSFHYDDVASFRANVVRKGENEKAKTKRRKRKGEKEPVDLSWKLIQRVCWNLFLLFLIKKSFKGYFYEGIRAKL